MQPFKQTIVTLVASKIKIFSTIIALAVFVGFFSFFFFNSNERGNNNLATANFSQNADEMIPSFTDENVGESVIIKSDQENYAGDLGVESYFSVENTSQNAENFDIQFYFPKNVDVGVVVVERKTENGWASVGDLSTAVSRPNDFINKKIIPKIFGAEGRFTSSISGEVIEHFRAKMVFAEGAQGEFWIEAIGDKGGYGLLDPGFAHVKIRGGVGSQVSPTSGLVAHWKLGEGSGVTTSDASGNGNNGEINGATWTTGKIGQALDFNGSSQYVTIGNPVSLQINGDISMCAWVNYRGTSKFILAKSDGATRDYAVYISSAGYLTLYSGAGGYTSAPNTVPSNQWSHVCITVASTNITYYIDNTAYALGQTTTIANTNKSLSLGRDGNSPGFDWDGYIDEVRIYNRALSTQDVQNIYLDPGFPNVKIRGGGSGLVKFRGGGSGAVACTASVAVQYAGTINQYTGTSFSTTLTNTATDANTAMFLVVSFDGAGAAITSCTYDGVAFTSAGTPAHNPTNNLNTQIFWLMNPHEGSGLTLACTGTNISEYYVTPPVFTNVNATTPVRSGTYQTGTGASMIITSNSQDYTITGIEASVGTTASNQTYVNTNAGIYSAGSDIATTPASSVTHTWTANGSYAMAGLSVQCK